MNTQVTEATPYLETPKAALTSGS